MVEREVAGADVAANRAALVAALIAMDARAVGRICGVAGSVDAVADRYRLPGGGEIEVWSDSYTALSLRGDPAVTRSVASAAGVDLKDG